MKTQIPVKNEETPFGLPDEEKIIHQHPWKLSREDSVLNAVKKRNSHNFADIGVNDMFYTKKLKSFSPGNVYAVDLFFPEEGIIKDGITCLNDIKKLPENELDCIVMMDVLEHIEDDFSFFNTVVDKLKVGGTVLITVPAFQFLFSAHDRKVLHFRRYNRKQLLKVLKNENLKIENCHYFYTSLFLIRLLLCLRKEKFGGNSSKWNYPENHIITIFFKMILNLDFIVNKILDKFFIRLPGLSLFAVCRKK
jgi:hypothetical protein